MAFAAPLRTLRALAVTVAAALLASGLVFVAAPASAATASDPAFPGVAEALPTAVEAAAEIAAAPGETDPDGTAVVSGQVTFPDGTDLSAGRTFVAAYAPGADAGSPLAAVGVTDGSYSLRVPQGDVVLGVVSEGRAVFDQGPAGRRGRVCGARRVRARRGARALRPRLRARHRADRRGHHRAAGRRRRLPGGRSRSRGRRRQRRDGRRYVRRRRAAGGRVSRRLRIVGRGRGLGVVAGRTSIREGAAARAGCREARPGIDAALEALHRMETSVPTISGTPVVGQTLRALPGPGPRVPRSATSGTRTERRSPRRRPPPSR